MFRSQPVGSWLLLYDCRFLSLRPTPAPAPPPPPPKSADPRVGRVESPRKRTPPGSGVWRALGNVQSEPEENGSFANSVTGAWGLGCTGGPGKCPRPRNPLQYYCRSCTGAPGAGNATPVGICRAPNMMLRSGNATPVGIGQSLPDVS